LLTGALSAAPALAGERPPVGAPAPAASSDGWRLAAAGGAPPWLTFGLDERLRFETLDEDFRATAQGGGAALVNRLLVRGEVRVAPLVVGLELADARAWSAPGTLLNTGIVDPLELLRAYVGLRFEGLLRPGDVATLTVGRLTLDVGSRRLLARNDFRNTINSFTGVDLQYVTPGQHLLRGLVVVPVDRLPSGAEALARNAVQFNLERWNQLLWGLFVGSAPGWFDAQLEGFVFGLHERDAEGLPTLHRNLLTPGVRLWRAPQAGRLDFEVEGLLQLGASRASAAASDELDLAHVAGSLHAEVGFRANLPATPRLALAWDFASGDADPGDGQNNHFDPLFAARRFEWGPSGLYGALGRSNLNSPGARLELAPHRLVDGFVAWRAAWLASARDGWAAAGLRDETGASGTFMGQQLEGRVRITLAPKNLALDVGAAVFFAGDFTRATQPRAWRESTYVYLQWSAWL
jgi:hypothetical protein